MSTEATLDAPASAADTYTNNVDASSIMSRFNSTPKEESSTPAPATAPAPNSEPAAAPPSDPTPPAPAPVDDSGVETPLSDLGGDTKTDEPKSDLPIDEDPPGPVKTEAAKYKWGELRKKADEYDALVQKTLPQKEKELAEAKAKLEELSKIDPSAYEKQLAEKEAAIAEYEKKMAVFDIQSSKQYQEQVLVPINRVGEELNNLARHYETDLSQIEAAMTILDPVAQEKRLMEIAEGWHPRHQNKLFDLAEKTVQLYSVAEQLEANALEARRELESARELETRKQQEESMKAIQTSAEAVKKQMLAKVPVLKDEALQQKVFAAELDPKDPVRKAYNAYAGEALPAVLKELAARDARIRELEQAAQARAAAQPRPGAGNASVSAAAASNPETPMPEGESLWQRMRQFAQS